MNFKIPFDSQGTDSKIIVSCLMFCRPRPQREFIKHTDNSRAFSSCIIVPVWRIDIFCWAWALDLIVIAHVYRKMPHGCPGNIKHSIRKLKKMEVKGGYI